MSLLLSPALVAGVFIPEAKAAEPGPVASAATPEISAAALALATQIVDAGYPEESREELFFATMDQTVTQMRQAIAPSLPDDDAGAIKILDDWIAEYTSESKTVLRKHIPAIMDGMVEAYATIFTAQELKDILAFVRTPSGQKYFELSPAISGSKSFADANQRYLDESVALIRPAQEQLKSRLDAYYEEQKAKNSTADT
ncbi:MAG: DUF2059 domain-containing protein [Pseudomonadota bacterium]|nr:DUF2059 domain-containing protein [Pseudomonadota bacterium]